MITVYENVTPYEIWILCDEKKRFERGGEGREGAKRKLMRDETELERRGHRWECGYSQHQL